MIVLVSAILASLLLSTSVAAAPATWSAPGYHLVRAGQTLYSIGRLYGVSPWAIASANHLADASKIYAGQWLYIPSYGYSPRYGRYHWVRAGETMLSISRLYGVSPWVIASANGIYNLNRIYAGQRLVIPYRW
jgi:spore germination protein